MFDLFHLWRNRLDFSRKPAGFIIKIRHRDVIIFPFVGAIDIARLVLEFHNGRKHGKDKNCTGERPYRLFAKGTNKKISDSREKCRDCDRPDTN